MKSCHNKQATAASANAIDKPLLMLRIELASLGEPAGADVDLATDTDDDAVMPPFATVVLDEGGATAARAPTVDHVAAELAPLLPWVYGKKLTAPLLVS
jgi:hypothetical protein